ncbi:MAG: hypothetical protein JKY08_09015 [Flavobacteriaceae bacterium]|nr:hypothetical protein [Flavobacteriaceae bacterium]
MSLINSIFNAMKIKLLTITIFILLFTNTICTAQVDAELLVKVHEVTADEMVAIASPNTGSLAFNTSNKKLYIYDGVQWVAPHKSPIDVFNTAANTTNFTPPNTFAYHKLDAVIPPISTDVIAGDIIDISLQLAVDYIANYNNIGEIIKFYITINGTNITDTIFDGFTAGGDNKYESGYVTLNQSFKLTETGKLKVGIQMKAISNVARIYAPEYLGKGGLNLMIYR